MVGTQFQTHKKCNHSLFLHLLLVIWDVITNKLLPRCTSRSFYLCFLLGILVSSTWFKSSAHFKIIYMCRIGFQCHSFACEYQDFPSPFVVETIFSLLHIFDTLVKDQLIMDVWVYLWTLFCFIGLCIMNKWDHIKLISFWMAKEESTESKGNFWTGTKYLQTLLLERFIARELIMRENIKRFRMRKWLKGLWSLKSYNLLSASWRPWEAREVVPTQIQRPESQGRHWSKSISQSRVREDHHHSSIGRKETKAVNFFCHFFLFVFVLFKPSMDWSMLTHVREDHLLY